MKLKKNILRFLTLSILLNNFYFYSNAITLNRYETLEGEMITLDNIEADDITEIEIFGNTVQDENNLNDIQHVGVWNEEKQGYEVEITAGKLNGLYKEITTHDYLEVKTYKQFKITSKNGTWADCILSTDLPLKMKEYTLNVKVIDYNFSVNNKNAGWIVNWNAGTQNVVTPSFEKGVIQTFKFTPRADNHIGNIFGVQFKNTALSGDWIELEMWLEEGVEELTQKILLPCQLMKIEDIADRLYWDNNKRQYIIEKNIGEVSNEFIYNNFNRTNSSENRSFIYDIWNNVDTGPLTNRKTLIHQKDDIFNRAVDHGFNTLYLYHNEEKLLKAGYEETNESVKQAISDTNVKVYFQFTAPQLIDTNITKQLSILACLDMTHIFIKSDNGVNPTLKITIDRIEQVSGEAVENVLSNPTSSNIALARMFVNMLPESLYKDQLQAQLNEIFSEDMVLDRLTSTANLDVYIQSENILMMSLDTNTVTFEEYSGVEELELQNAINISVNSSLPYQLNAYIVGDIVNKDKDKTLDLDVFNIKDSSTEEYKQFSSINTKLVLLDNVSKGNNISHNIDLKLSGDKAHDADVYKTTIKFEAEQK